MRAQDRISLKYFPSVCVASAMRIVSIGNMKKEDVTGMATTVGPLCLAPAKSFFSHYGSRVSLVPSRASHSHPLRLHHNLPTTLHKYHIDLSNVSGLFSKGTVESKGSRKGGWTDLENDLNHNFTWPVGKDPQGRDGPFAGSKRESHWGWFAYRQYRPAAKPQQAW